MSVSGEQPTSPAPAGEAVPPKPPRNIGKELDEKRRALVQARIALADASQELDLAEAKRRAKLRTVDESTGKRQSCADIRADIIVARNTPGDEIERAWIQRSLLRARVLKLEADVKIWRRYEWAEINRGRYGA